ncbi:S1 family peptidase [Kitasatospora aureofaciens]|uniref:S1 family peptidase n=1 Tax=Kitasatospora aureofaciens TaxID=1894 RepID=UPI001C47CF42|nr:S1 family peptidase [Kitasatospora aureofaciens]MBV6699125.1 S1 family peptidase [Kitasatospora aureofaciens]
MLRFRALAAACALATVALAAAPAAGAGAGTDDPSIAAALTTAQTRPVATSAAPPALLHALQRDLGLSPQAAADRLAHESRAAATQTALADALGSRWAGAWVTGPDATLVVATTDASAARTITAHGGTATVVRHSLATLDGAKAALDRAVAATTPEATPLWYVDVTANTVVVQSADADRTEAFLRQSGVDRDLVRVDRAADAPRPLADLHGGDAYYIDSAARCSIGFPVTQNGQPGFVSAGHCGQPGSNATASDGSSIGTFQGSTFPGNDYSWVQADPSWTAQPQVSDYSGGAVTVSGSSVAPIGSSICRSGSTTGWHCGTVQEFGATVNYAEGTVYGLTRTDVCAEPGDSGGSFISGSQAQGVTSGGSGNCTSGGTTFFQPVNPILQAYGLTLATG